jgi:hypothetical protein
MRPFESGKFIRDEFFRKSSADESGTAAVTHGGTTATIRCGHRSGLDPVRDGQLIQRGGKWREIVFWLPDWVAAFGAGSEPAHADTIDLEGDTYRVEAFSKDGDLFTIKSLASQRLMKR